MSKFKDTIIKIIVTCFFVGKIKYAPGTFGSLLAFPLSYFIISFTMQSGFMLNVAGFSHEELAILTLIAALLTTIFVLFIVGTICSSLYVKATEREDPKEVVIDEVVGQMLVVTIASFSVVFAHKSKIGEMLGETSTNFVFLFLMPFVLFRLFDIFKPWPIDWLDKNVKGGIGIMLDDVLAAVFAIVVQYAVTFTII